MSRRNRVTPYGDLIATPARGTLFGNRGCLHDAQGRIVRWAVGRRWIACELAFKGRRRAPLLQPGRYTELFFLDEATALAAGHRPCVECRRGDFLRFADALGVRRAAEVDALLDGERPTASGPRLREARVASLPDGTMIEVDGAAHLLVGGRLLRWSPAGYTPASIPRGTARVLTPPSVTRALAAGYRPRLHPSAS